MVSQSGSVGCALMGKTADFTVIKMRIINGLHKETLKVIVKAAVCSRRAVSMHVNGKKELWKKGNAGKRCTRNNYNCHPEKIVKRRCGTTPIQEYGGESQEWTATGVSLQDVSWSHRIPRSKQRRRWRLTCVKVGLHCYRVVQRPLSMWKTILYLTWTSRSQSLEDEWRCTGAWAPAWIAPGIADVIFQQDLAAAHAAVNISTWCKDCGIPVLHWPANSWNPSENLWAIVKRKMRDTRSNYAEEPKVTIKATWTSCYRLTTSRPGS